MWVGSRIQKQQSMTFSPFMQIYDIVVPQDNMLRKINELVDFSFVYEELKENYCHDNGRNAVDPIRMFKYLLLKTIHDLSDVDIVERSKYKERYKIEAKNSELKHRHGYDVVKSSGLIGMELQGAMAIFTVNIKRILKLLG